jgi:hypothetical protein
MIGDNTIFQILSVLALAAFSACSPPDLPSPPAETAREPSGKNHYAALDELAEAERFRGFVPGLGLTESNLREEQGDLGGAVIAAYKELAWSYAAGDLSREGVEAGLKRVLELYPGESGGEAVQAARGALAFFNGRWTEAGEILTALFDDTEPDSFPRWMMLVCALEEQSAKGETALPESSRTLRSAYGSIRGRYAAFPEYWYRAARCFPGSTALEYAERCIDLAPRGPFAGEARRILAERAGLSPRDGAALKSRAEIEEVLLRALASGDAALLADLFPLLALGDNPYTLYAVGVLKAAAAAEAPFRNFFTREAERNAGRLAERLVYISRA